MPEHRRGRRVRRRVLLTLAVTFVAAAAVIGYFMFRPPPLPVVQIVEARLALQPPTPPPIWPRRNSSGPTSWPW